MKASKLVTSLLIAFSGATYAADNSIYIDQSGDGATITMTQEGAGNRIRGIQGIGTGDTTPAKIYGDNAQITVNQVGSGNVLNLGIVTATASGGINPTINYSTYGSNSVASIDVNANGQGAAASNYIAVTQGTAQVGASNSITQIAMLGSGNSLSALQTGAYATLTATVDGNDNQTNVTTSGGTHNTVNVTQSGDNHSATVTVVGGANTVGITQTGGVGGHSATVNLSGSSNTVGISQTNTAMNSVVNLQSQGSGNTFNITSR